MILSRLRLHITERLREEPVGAALLALAQESVVYLFGLGFIGLANLVLVPLYIRYLTPAEFGVYALVEVTILALVAVTQLKFDVSYLKWFAESEPSQHGALLGSIIATGALASTLGGGLLAIAVAGSPGEHWLKIGDRSFAWIILPLVVSENLQGLFLTDLRARRKAGAYSAILVLRSVVVVVASLFLIAFERQSIKGVFLGRLIGDGVGLVALGWVCLRSTRLRFTMSVLPPMLRFGLPLIWSIFVVMMLDASGRFYLSSHSTIEQVGFYGAAIKISGVFQVFVNQPFGVAWGGLLFQIIKWPGARTVYSKILAYVFLLSMAAALVLYFLTPTLFGLLATTSYLPAVAVFPLILLVRAVTVMEYPSSTAIYLSGRTFWFGLIYSLGLAVNFLLLYVLVPHYGMFGAASSWLVAWVVITGLMACIGQRFYRLYYDWKLLLPPIVLWAFILVGNHLFAESIARLRWPFQILFAFFVVFAAATLLTQDLRTLRPRIGPGETTQ